jgi:hypothetical protein
MGRVIEGRKNFLNTKDRTDLIARLKQLADDTSMPVYAWALLPLALQNQKAAFISEYTKTTILALRIPVSPGSFQRKW